MRKLGDSVYLIRAEKGLSQKELAKRSGVPQPNISAIEKGRDFKISTLYRLASALEVSPADLINGIQPIPINKERFFKRDNVEKLVNTLSSDHKNKAWNQLAKTLIVTLSNHSKKKDLHLSWIKLKRTFSRDELNTILSRLDKAKKRAESNAIST